MNKHYDQISLFTARALAHGVDSKETERLIRKDCVKMYLENVALTEEEKLEIKKHYKIT
jgi:hypothetical protein